MTDQDSSSPAEHPLSIAAARMRRVREYIVHRLREEVRGQHGAQARLAREFGMSTAHVSNVLSKSPTRAPGEGFVHAAAAHWGMTYGELEAAAASWTPSPPDSATSLSDEDRTPGSRNGTEG